MEKGICTVSVAAIRAESSHRSEMTSQILYGETVVILEKANDFFKVIQDLDGYEGWVNSNQITVFENDHSIDSKTELLAKTFEVRETLYGKMLLSIGSEIIISGIDKPKYSVQKTIIETACEFLNVPYLWSGRSFFGVDCSGFVQLVYKMHSFNLPREAHQQAEIGEVLSFAEESKPGDLAFFENEEGSITHVGILLNNHEIIHAFGRVRIDSLDSTGIFNKELKKHTHHLRFLRSII